MKYNNVIQLLTFPIKVDCSAPKSIERVVDVQMTVSLCFNQLLFRRCERAISIALFNS
jgi:hypothetical protein